MQKIFITSTGTNIGKTLVLCSLAKCLEELGKKIHAIKPVMSGFDFNAIPNDISIICESLGLDYTQENIKKITRYFFAESLSPDMAARVEDAAAVELGEVERFVKSIEQEQYNLDYLLIEGVGGLFVPLNESETTLDLIPKISDANILICGSYLGSLSHSISAYQNLVNAGIKPKLVLVTQSLSEDDELYISEKETLKSLENFISSPIITLEKLVSKGDEELIEKIKKQLKNKGINEFI